MTSLGKALTTLGFISLFCGAAFANLNITWVPPYSVGACKTCLQKDFGGVGMKDGISLLALQFYYPTTSGGLRKDVSDADVIWFRDWAHRSNVKVLLCVFNATGNWDWNLAISAFKSNKTAFVNALVAEVNRLGFDGVDIDLEGPDQGNAEQASFLAFLTDLKVALGSKVLTAETFAGPWHAPNWVWWPDWINKAKIDAIGCMGYDDTGLNGGAVTYPEEKAHCVNPNKFMMGMMGTSSSWAGNTANQHIDWILNNGGGMGIGIWDANLGSSWQTAEIWNKMKTLKNRNPVVQAIPSVAQKNDSRHAMDIAQSASGHTVSLKLNGLAPVSVAIYTLQGDRVALLADRVSAMDRFSVFWNGTGEGGERVSRGSYIASATVNGRTISKPLVLAR